MENNIIEYHKTAEGMSREEFALSRRDTFGGSDTSVLLGVNLYKKLEELREEKSRDYVTEKEMSIGDLPQVKKGSDLEPLILSKAEEILGEEIIKPADTYRFRDYPFMSVNFDGVVELEGEKIPVEAKFVTQWGEKYYKKGISIEQAKEVPMERLSPLIETHIKLMANKFGIPGYYYTQVQREIAALGAPYGYLMAWFDKNWEGKLFYIPSDPYVQIADIKASEENKDCLLEIENEKE